MGSSFLGAVMAMTGGVNPFQSKGHINNTTANSKAKAYVPPKKEEKDFPKKLTKKQRKLLKKGKK